MHEYKHVLTWVEIPKARANAQSQWMMPRGMSQCKTFPYSMSCIVQNRVEGGQERKGSKICTESEMRHKSRINRVRVHTIHPDMAALALRRRPNSQHIQRRSRGGTEMGVLVLGKQSSDSTRRRMLARLSPIRAPCPFLEVALAADLRLPRPF